MKDEALKLALEALKRMKRFGNTFGYRSHEQNPYEQVCEAVDVCEQALAAPVQEPVGDDWTPCMKLPVVVHVRKQRHGESHVSTREGITPVKPDDLIMRGVSGEEYPIGRAIFEQTYTLDTTPPAQQAVEVCCGKYKTCLKPCTPRGEFLALSAIEAKLKEKNI